MLIDHTGFGIIHAYLMRNAMSILPQSYTKLNDIYEVCRDVGRLAMPIFTFFIVEGFLRTSNLKKYCLRLFIFALISEIPFDLGLYNSFFYTDHQNVLFTFVIGLLMLMSVRYLNKTIVGLSDWVKGLALIAAVVAFADVAYLLKCDYSFKGIILMAVLYFLRECKSLRLLAGAATFSWEKFAPISFLLLYFYDPDKKPRLKYFFYAFYPLHLLLICVINRLFFI